MNKWYLRRGAEDDIIISSAMVLKRNLYDYSFPPKMTDQEAMKVLEETARAFFLGDELMARRYQFIRLDKLEDQQRLFFVQRLVVDPEAMSPRLPEALILSDDESASIWLNSSDHVQIKVMNRGLRIGRIYDIARDLDEVLQENLKFAYSKKYGYLTTAPADLGTGMHISFYVHIPFTEASGAMDELVQDLEERGFVINLMKDIPSRSAGHIFEVTNSVTLGVSEQDILERSSEVADLLISKERELKALSLLKYKTDYEDNIYKAYGILKFAKKLSIEDATEYLSYVDQGVNDKTLKLAQPFDVLPILIDIQPRCLAKRFGVELTTGDDARIRALYIQERLPEMATDTEVKP